MYSNRIIVNKATIENHIEEQPFIDLSNYFPKHQSFNSVIYYHKKFLAKDSCPCVNRDKNKFHDNSKNIPTQKFIKRSNDNRDKHHNLQDNSKMRPYLKDKKKHKGMNESLVQQTITFARDIIPLMLPPSLEGSNEAYYTVKSVKPKKVITKEKARIVKTQKSEYVDPKTCIETFRKDTCFRESSTAMETTSHMSSLQGLKLSESLNCSLSEISNRPNKKKRNMESTSYKGNAQDTKLVVSESLQALADNLNQSTASANRIKLHVMTEQDKTIITEGVRNAVITAVMNSIEEISKCKVDAQEIVTMQKSIKCVSNKLDNIVDRLSSIEVDIANVIKEKSYRKPIDTETKILVKHNVKEANTSTLEQLGEDLFEQNVSDCDNSVDTSNSRDTRRNIQYLKIDTIHEIENQGCGEDIPKPRISSADQFDLKQGRTTRIPTRYCWTDTSSRPNTVINKKKYLAS